MPNCRERIVVIETFDERDVPVREPAPELEVWRGCGPERGEYEARHAHANDNGDVRAEYTPPGGRAA